MPDSVKRFLEVYEVMEQIALVLWMLLYDDSTIEDLFYYAPAWSETCLFFCQQFLSLCLKSAEHNSENDLVGMADEADGTIVLPLLQIAFLE